MSKFYNPSMDGDKSEQLALTESLEDRNQGDQSVALKEDKDEDLHAREEITKETFHKMSSSRENHSSVPSSSTTRATKASSTIDAVKNKKVTKKMMKKSGNKTANEKCSSAKGTTSSEPFVPVTEDEFLHFAKSLLTRPVFNSSVKETDSESQTNLEQSPTLPLVFMPSTSISGDESSSQFSSFFQLEREKALLPTSPPSLSAPVPSYTNLFGARAPPICVLAQAFFSPTPYKPTFLLEENSHDVFDNIWTKATSQVRSCISLDTLSGGSDICDALSEFVFSDSKKPPLDGDNFSSIIRFVISVPFSTIERSGESASSCWYLDSDTHIWRRRLRELRTTDAYDQTSHDSEDVHALNTPLPVRIIYWLESEDNSRLKSIDNATKDLSTVDTVGNEAFELEQHLRAQFETDCKIRSEKAVYRKAKKAAMRMSKLNGKQISALEENTKDISSGDDSDNDEEAFEKTMWGSAYPLAKMSTPSGTGGTGYNTGSSTGSSAGSVTASSALAISTPETVAGTLWDIDGEHFVSPSSGHGSNIPHREDAQSSLDATNAECVIM